MAKILQFPNKTNPSPEDIVILMRAAIKIRYRSVLHNVKACTIMSSVRT